MKAVGSELDTFAPLHPGEIVLWSGQATLLPAIHMVPFLICFGLVVLISWATWFSPAQGFAGTEESAAPKVVMLLLLVLFTGGLLFLSAERFMLSSGRASARILLTDRRLIRITDWPWLRVWAGDYRVNLPHLVTPGVLRHGRYFTISLSPRDAEKVLDMIQRQRSSLL